MIPFSFYFVFLSFLLLLKTISSSLSFQIRLTSYFPLFSLHFLIHYLHHFVIILFFHFFSFILSSLSVSLFFPSFFSQNLSLPYWYQLSMIHGLGKIQVELFVTPCKSPRSSYKALSSHISYLMNTLCQCQRRDKFHV